MEKPSVQPELPASRASKGMVWTGRVLTALVGLMMLAGGLINLAKPEFVVKSTVEQGIRETVIVPIGAALTVSAILYLIPVTTVLGAILLTGYFGGAICTHVLKGDGAVEILIPAIFGVATWFGVYFREPRLRAIVPLRT